MKPYAFPALKSPLLVSFLKFPLWLIFLVIFSLGSCGDPSNIGDDLLDGKLIIDPSIMTPENYLISVSNPNPSPKEASRPVFILCHGYSATTFEWSEFVEWSGETDSYYTSRVLLGGHGKSYEDFKSSSWEEWQQSIFDEYEALLDAGYTNIHLVGSSASAALILEAVSSGYFNGKTPPKNIIFIDPIILPSDKLLPLIGVVGPLIGYMEVDNTEIEKSYWFTYRPQETLQELQNLLKKVRLKLQKGISLPPETNLTVFKSIQDPTADPASALLIYKGLSPSQQVNIQMINSSLHVFTRLQGRVDTISSLDRLNQEETFQKMVELALAK